MIKLGERWAPLSIPTEDIYDDGDYHFRNRWKVITKESSVVPLQHCQGILDWWWWCLEYFYFSAFDLEVKATEILDYIPAFSGKKYGQGRRINYQVLGKYKSWKLFGRVPERISLRILCLRPHIYRICERKNNNGCQLRTYCAQKNALGR